MSNYGDDLILLSPSGLQNEINNLSKYCTKWHLQVNIKKTKVINFSGNGHSCKHTFLNDLPIENTQKYRYLGVEFHTSGSFNSSKSNLASIAKKAVFSLYSGLSNSNISPILSLKLFDQLIKPICLYGSEIWSPENLLKNNQSISE
jgi:hypothetical protein